MENNNAHFSLSINELRQHRKYQEIDLYRMYKTENIYRDYRGYYMFEIHAVGVEQKFYFEESYQYMERKLLHFYNQANQLYTRMLQMKDLSEKHLFMDFMKVDYQLYLLLSFYTGQEYHPFMSPKQINRWLGDQLHLNIYCEILSNKEETPLDSIKKIKVLTGKANPCKEFVHKYKDFQTTKHQGNRLFQLLPYRMSSRKEK
ncbi:hypothetical protein LC040_17665 [Bacillus tianshenii]|nr:hypothetical protein LC040_17665 [Bacillus tianshenii]